MGWQNDHENVVSRFPVAIRDAHAHSSAHRKEVLASTVCGCFYCLAIYTPNEIKDWIDPDASGEGQTALCAKCGIDSVIGDKAGFAVTPEFLSEMNRHWF
jgi:hypothetical protein